MLGKFLRFLFGTTVWLLKAVLIVCWKGGARLLRGRPTTFGSARWATLGDMTKGRALGGETGIIVGKAFGQFLRFKKDGAVMVCAPQGSGKGVGFVIPNILDHQGSLVVSDPKGENYAVTHRHREDLGPVYRLDAIHPEETDCFNPFSMVRVGTHHEADDVMQIADLLVVQEDDRSSHWETSAKNFIAEVIRYVIHERPPELRNLSEVRHLVAGDADQQRSLLENMAACQIASVSEEARSRLAAFDVEETKNVISNAQKALKFWSSDRIGGRMTKTSDFDMMDLHREGMTVYVMIPDDQIEIYKPLLRIIIGCAITALMRGKDRPRPDHKPMLLLDECAALGRLDVLAKAMGMLREYCHMLQVWQDLGQLRSIYGEHTSTTFIAGSGAQVFFAISDNQTARGLADDVGQSTVLSSSNGTSAGMTDLFKMQLQSGRSEAQRYLIDPSEARRLGPDECIVQMGRQVQEPIRAKKIKYYNERRWDGRFDPWRTQADGMSSAA